MRVLARRAGYPSCKNSRLLTTTGVGGAAGAEGAPAGAGAGAGLAPLGTGKAWHRTSVRYATHTCPYANAG